MAILESCCGCGLAVSCAVLGVYLSVAYAVAFATELWWILDSSASPVIPVYLLCLGYFILLSISALLLRGLSAKKTTYLLVWLFMMGIFLGPEAGLVLYLSIHHWRITSLHGLIEVTCWSCRLLVNGIGLLCVQSLHSVWSEEKKVLLRLETLKTGSLAKSQVQLSATSVLCGHEKKITPPEEIPKKSDVSPYVRTCNSFNVLDSKREDYDCSFIDERFAKEKELSEFNASSFDPTVIDARLENMPYLTIRKKPKLITGSIELFLHKKIIPKTRSLIDFRDADLQDFKEAKHLKNLHSPTIIEKSFPTHENQEINVNGLDRQIIKNKNLKILKKLSPFNNRKAVEMNIYQINPPKDLIASSLDFQLNKFYSLRGMYAFDEKLKKVVYYPPELFEKSKMFRSRMDSYNSNQSRSSIDTDSEDIRHISDVAL